MVRFDVLFAVRCDSHLTLLAMSDFTSDLKFGVTSDFTSDLT